MRFVQLNFIQSIFIQLTVNKSVVYTVKFQILFDTNFIQLNIVWIDDENLVFCFEATNPLTN